MRVKDRDGGAEIFWQAFFALFMELKYKYVNPSAKKIYVMNARQYVATNKTVADAPL